MATANQFTDGVVNSYNSLSLTVTNSTGAAYTTAMTVIAETFTVSRPYKHIQVENHLGVYVGGQFTRGHVTGSATVQVPSVASVAKTIQAGATFTVDLGDDDATESFIITSVDKSYSQNDIVKQNISFSQLIGAIGAIVQA